MKITLEKHTIGELIEGYKDSQEDGVVGYGGRLNIRPAYQREFVYDDAKRAAVIHSVMRKFPLNTMYWMKGENENYELLDGQQRTISICQYCTGEFPVMVDGKPKAFFNLTQAEKKIILEYELMIYVCEGTDTERLDWFRVINIGGEKLTDQEMRNAVYSGTWTHDAKKRFSKRGCPAYQIANQYLSGSMIRQEYLETAISWMAATKGQTIDEYMSDHQHDASASELWLYFNTVIEWVRTVIPNYRKEMKGLNWGEIYEKYHHINFSPVEVEREISELYADPHVTNKKGIFQFILDGCEEYSLLHIRVFDNATKATIYEQQTAEAKRRGISNCPDCAHSGGANSTRIYSLDEMDADHVTPWSNGGKTDISNCQMLCVHHNRLKGNR